MMMSNMMSMQGACPQGQAAMMAQNMMGTSTETPVTGSTGTGSSTTGSATMEATSATGTGSTGTSSTTGTATPMLGATMEATSETGLTGTEEMMGVKCLFGQFSGTAEVPGPGDTDGTGVVFVSVDPASGNICYEEAVSGITLPASATHIHVNAAGLSGDVVVPFPVAPDANGKASGCTTVTVAGLAQAIATNPEGYYVNVHTSDFPSGAVRAQLSDWSTSPMNTGMMGTMEPGMTSTQDMSGTSSSGTGSTVVTPEATTSG